MSCINNANFFSTIISITGIRTALLCFLRGLRHKSNELVESTKILSRTLTGMIYFFKVKISAKLLYLLGSGTKYHPTGNGTIL